MAESYAPLLHQTLSRGARFRRRKDAESQARVPG